MENDIVEVGDERDKPRRERDKRMIQNFDVEGCFPAIF